MAPNSTAGDEAGIAYIDRSAVNAGMLGAAQLGAFGLLVSAVQNSIQKHNRGALGIFTRTGSTVAFFTAVGGAFAFTDAATANFRRKNDPWNGAAGGCAVGVVFGAATRSLPMMAGSCAGIATLMYTFDAAGASLTGPFAKPSPLDTGDDHPEGKPAWKVEREERRKRFFKQPKEEVQTE